MYYLDIEVVKSWSQTIIKKLIKGDELSKKELEDIQLHPIDISVDRKVLFGDLNAEPNLEHLIQKLKLEHGFVLQHYPKDPTTKGDLALSGMIVDVLLKAFDKNLQNKTTYIHTTHNKHKHLLELRNTVKIASTDLKIYARRTASIDLDPDPLGFYMTGAGLVEG